VGSRNEVEPGRSGYAHFFEHMMFRGTDRYPQDKYESVIKKYGANNNAYTDDDLTVYTIIGRAEGLEKFVEIVGPLKPRFIHHPRTKELLLELLRDLGCDMDKTYFDVPRMRVATSDGYLTAGLAYVLHPHRDIWYGSPPCQLNWWLPVFSFESESSFAFHERYWTEPVPNTSNEYNHYAWNKTGRANAAKEVTRISSGMDASEIVSKTSALTAALQKAVPGVKPSPQLAPPPEVTEDTPPAGATPPNDGKWGVYDVDDCIAAAQYLAERGDVDPDRMTIRGGSAGGYTTLCALVFHDTFAAGASHYGVGDLEALARDPLGFDGEESRDSAAAAVPREWWQLATSLR
jgi:hypothetical protein